MLYAWTNRETPDELVEAQVRLPGLGLVLKSALGRERGHDRGDCGVTPRARKGGDAV